jgi:hypothetical protein
MNIYRVNIGTIGIPLDGHVGGGAMVGWTVDLHIIFFAVYH